MNPTIQSVTVPLDRRPSSAASEPGAGTWTNVQAIAGVVLKELYRRKDFYVLFVLTALITLVMASVALFKQDHAVRALQDICLFLIWASALVIAVTATARQLPAEREHRTVFPLLAKPVTRNQVLLGKFLGCWVASGLALLVFYVAFGLMAGVQEHTWPLGLYFQAITLHWFALGVVCAMTLLGSLVFAAPSSTNTITLVVVTGLLLVARHLHKVASRLSEPGQTLLNVLYYVLPQLNIFDIREFIVHKHDPIAWPFFLAALAYAAVYSALFLTGACLLFRRKALN